ncbi:hypothetical protein DFQ28_006957 [Apophysomyces sp. BC1034]|nr:hypothetical protein DFQ30_005332 [Apophysomyces sp. BC1015]KAG0172504.1 hypothetical protein DFQ29_008341 [Apophysomyces sp. BC1021]KAG0187038.1 hypothetical protein DFQ28_006957 [Apophysomyces sp. BC1034]
MHPHPFQESFWSPSAAVDSIPNFSYGLNVLHQKLRQSMEENQAILDYLQRRITAEQAYADKLAILSTSGTAFENDLGAGLKKCFEVVCGESTESAQEHRTRAENLTATALDPLQRFSARYQRIVSQTKSSMDKQIGQFEILARAVGQAHSIYSNKCNAVQQLWPDFLPYRLGRRTFEREKIAQLLDNMQTDLLLSLTGRAILNWMRSYCDRNSNAYDNSKIDGETEDDEPLEICRDLMSYGFLTTVPACDTNNTAFDVADSVQYAIWKPMIEDEGHPVVAASFTGLLGRWGSQKNQEDMRRTMVEEMNDADGKYKETLRKAEKVRMNTEEALFMHYEEMESLELERIQTIKQAFISVAAALSNTIPLCKEMYDRIMLYQETFQPDKDVQFIVEQYHTGRFYPRPIIYVNHFFGCASDQVFGVSLEDYAQTHKTTVPPLISHGLSIIESVWTAQLPLDQIHAVRDRVNRPGTHTVESLKRYDLLELASLVRLYFMELPECLLTFELYEPIKVLYSNYTQADQDRLASISKLLSTLPSANYYTLKMLMGHFHKLTATGESEDLLNALALTFSHLLIRPQIESTLNLHERHPQRLVRDLIRHFQIVFSAEAGQAHEDHIHRRVIIAATEEVSKEPSLEAPSFVSSGSSGSTPSSIQVPTPTCGSLERSATMTTTADPAKPATPTRRRTLLSFMRRSSNEQPGHGRGGAAVACRPIPMPSSSTLFEDPDEMNTQSNTNIPATPGHHQRAISLSTIGTADQSGLDSFFEDEDV